MGHQSPSDDVPYSTRKRPPIKINSLVVKTGGRAWKAIGDRVLKSFWLSRDDHNRKIRNKK